MLLAGSLRARHVTEQREPARHAIELGPGLLLALGAERPHILLALDLHEAGLVRDTLGCERIEVDAVETALDRGQALLVGALACIENVVEGAEALRPLAEVLTQIQQVSIVLQAFLKFVRRDELVQITRLGRVGEIVQAPIPARCVGHTIAKQLVDEDALLDGSNGCVHSTDLGIEGVDSAEVIVGRLLVGAELTECVGNRQQRLLYGRVEDVATPELQPRRQCRAIIPDLGVCPTDAEERLVGEGSTQPHTL